jgi:hypothetical protein
MFKKLFVLRPNNLLSRSAFCFAVLFAFNMVLPAAEQEAPFAGVELAIPDETVPPGGMLQIKVQITEPRPISKGGQKTRITGKIISKPVGIELFSPKGDASGTAVWSNDSVQLSLSSSLIDMGQNVDYPVVTIAAPVKTTAQRGQAADLILDSGAAKWIDPAGKTYPVLLTNGMLVVGGSLSIMDVVPGGGVQKAGTKVAIKGMGFPKNFKVQVNDAKISKQTWVSANEIDVTLARDTNMTSRRIRVENPATNERVTYYSYARTVPVGSSTNSLIAATVPLFSQITWTSAYVKPMLGSSRFNGVAVQNSTSRSATVKLQLLSTSGAVVVSRTVTLGAYQRISRDVVEWFPSFTISSGNIVKVTSSIPVQVLGLAGNELFGTVDPISPTAKP